MRVAATIGLAAFWIAWVTPFVTAAIRGERKPVRATAPRAKWGILLQGGAYFLVWFRVHRLPEPHPTVFAAAMVLAAVSASCSWAAVRHLGGNWRVQAAVTDEHTLVRTGPYRFVRHPIYASMFGMLIATGMLFCSPVRLLAACIVFLAGTEVRVGAEDALLAAHFGEQFDAYRAQVPAYIPFVR